MSVFSICDYGARPDGVNCASAIQAAIDAAHAQGGGQVLVPAGRFLSGSILLKSHVNLHLSSGAVLVSSLNEDDILPFPSGGEGDAVDGWNGGFFLGARDACDITISGSGVIDGQGNLVFTDRNVDAGFHECPKSVASFRPRLTLFENVEDLTIQDVTLKDAAFWTLHMAGCRRVMISGIRILGDDRGANNDGIDPDCCQDVAIQGCIVSTGDDAIVVKATGPMHARYGDSENITISGCVLHSRDSALKIGTETHGSIRNIVFSDCVIKDCSRAAGIWVRDGGTVENIQIHHLTGCTRRWGDAYDLPGDPGWWGKGEPIFVSCTPRAGKQNFPGKIQHLSIDHVRLTCESSFFLGGEKDSPIEDIRVSDVQLEFRHTGTQPGGLFDEQPSARHKYPHSIPALYARSVHGLRIRDMSAAFFGEHEAWDGTLEELEDCLDVHIRWEDEA